MKVLPSFWCKQDFCYSFLMNTAFLFADPNLLHLEYEAMINTDDAPSQRSADAIAPFAPKARENHGPAPFGTLIWPHLESKQITF
jgi:hypothetical protein